MTFNDNAQLDTSQVQSGGSGGFGGGGGGFGGGPVIGGVGGIIIMILMALFGGHLTGGGPSSTSQGGYSGNQGNYGGNQGGYGNSLQGYARDTQDVSGSGDRVAQEISECKTGADANTHDVCRIVGTVNAVQSYWNAALPKFTNNRTQYEDVPTVIFSGQTSSGCGTASAAMGPFYCPTDRKVYIDAAFFKELNQKYGADDGNLAKEYVLAHEYGHHVQDLLGALGRAQQDPQGAQSGSVRTELQADCYAGIWVAHATESKDASGNTLLKPVTEADIKSALSAAKAVGDDTIEKNAGRQVTPEAWTHGSSEARQKWFMTGYRSGDLNSCDTFSPETVE